MFWLQGFLWLVLRLGVAGLARRWPVVAGKKSDWGGAVGAGLRWVAEVGAEGPRRGGARLGTGGRRKSLVLVTVVRSSPARGEQPARELVEPRERAATGLGL